MLHRHLADKPTRWQSTRWQDNSLTNQLADSQLADKTTRWQDNSLTRQLADSQLADKTTRWQTNSLTVVLPVILLIVMTLLARVRIATLTPTPSAALIAAVVSEMLVV